MLQHLRKRFRRFAGTVTHRDTVLKGGVHMSTQYGIDDLGPYRTRNKQLPGYLQLLDRAVTKPMIDRFLLEEVELLGFSLDIERENKSVTEPEWFWKGLDRYACPVHSLRTYGARVFCSCGRRNRGSQEERSNQRSEIRPGLGTGDGRSERARKGAAAVRGSVRHDVRSHPSADGGSGAGNSSRAKCRPEGARYRRALKAVRRAVLQSTRGVVPLSVDEVVDYNLRDSAASGLPHLGHNGDPGQKDRHRALAYRVIAGERGLDPYLGGRRVQSGESAPKTRLVWMASLVTTIVGGMFAIPLQAALKKRRPFTWGFSSMEKGAVISEMDGKFRYIYGTDYSRFDSCVPAFILQDVFSILREMLDLPKDLEPTWDLITRDFIHTRIVGPDGHIYLKHHGIPSGSAFTSLVGSIVNLVVTQYIWVGATGHELSSSSILVMGDDALFGDDRYVSPQEMSVLAAELGFSLNPEKTGVTSGAGLRQTMFEWPHFLGHYWVNGVPHRPEREVAKAMGLPERHREQSHHISNQRKAGYAMTTRQGYRMVMALERDPRIFAAAASVMRKASGGEPVKPENLPGTLRQRVVVEGEVVRFSEGNPRSVLLATLH